MEVPLEIWQGIVDRIGVAIQNSPGPMYTLELHEEELNAMLEAVKGMLDG
jgi:hypothetical protein